MKSAALPFALCVLVVSATGYGAFVAWRKGQQAEAAPRAVAASGASKNSIIAPVDRTPNDTYQLTNQDEQEFDSADLKGKVWVANFFFANCPATCFRLMSEVSKLEREFADEDVHFVSMTVDPKNDTPEALKKYAARFGADHDRWTFLTGPIVKTEQIGQKIFKLPTADMTHSEKAVIMDRQGRFAGAFNLLKPEELTLMKVALRKVLAEKPEPAKTGASAKADAARAEAVSSAD